MKATHFGATIILGAALLMTPVAGFAAGAQDQAVADAVESLRVAMVAGDGAAMGRLLHDHLSYGHSDGHVDSKAKLIGDLTSHKEFQSLTLSEQSVDVVGDTAVVRHLFDAVNLHADGSTTPAHIKVLQIWRKENGAWRLLARQATKAPS